MMCESCHVFRGFLAMAETPNANVTELLKAAQQGDQDAAVRLLPHVYDELRKLARARMARLAPGETIQPTALVHEAYLRLLGISDLHVESQRHFFFVATRAMRDILVEQARSKAGPKRGSINLRTVEPLPGSKNLPHRGLQSQANRPSGVAIYP
jgi:RNA polymerase sigma factor (TIGR02999 family)